MATFTMELGGLSNAQHVVEELALPLLPHLGAVTACWKALDTCAASRTGVTVVGPKGAGKSVGIQHACELFAQMERELRRRHEAYRVRKVLRFGEIRCRSDREVALLLARRLDPRYSERANGQKKTVAQIRADIVSMCLRQQYAVIVVDEAETFADEALQFLRDLLRDARDAAPETGQAGTGPVPHGLGILLVGDDTFDPRGRLGREAGERWRQVIEVRSPEVGHVIEVLGTWFPGFAPHVERVGEVAWANHLASVIGRGRPISFRFVENVARLYAHYMVRSDPSIGDRTAIPFNRHLFELAAEECSWAHQAPQAKRPPKPRSSRARTGGAAT